MTVSPKTYNPKAHTSKHPTTERPRPDSHDPTTRQSKTCDPEGGSEFKRQKVREVIVQEVTTPEVGVQI